MADALNLRPWQRRFLTGILAPGIRTAALSLPRGNGKSALVAHLARRFLTPGDALHVAGTEAHIAAASIGQARRTVFRLLRELIENGPDAADYRIAESALDVSRRPRSEQYPRFRFGVERQDGARSDALPVGVR